MCTTMRTEDCYPGVPPDGPVCVPRSGHGRSTIPVVAYGANRSIETLLARLGDRGPPLLIEPVRALGLAVVWSARLSVRGLAVATAVFAPGAVAHVHLVWMDEADVAALDRHEGVPTAYRRVPAWFRVRSLFRGGAAIRPWIYVDNAGPMWNPDGRMVAVKGVGLDGLELPEADRTTATRSLRRRRRRA